MQASNRRWVGGGAVAAACFVWVALAAAGSIVPGVSLAGIRLGEDAAAVKASLGPPGNIEAGRPGSGVVRWDYRTHNRLSIVLTDNHVMSVVVAAVDGEHVYDHTAGGIGLLSTVGAVQRAYPGHCFIPPPATHYAPVCRIVGATGTMTMQAGTGVGTSARIHSITLA